MAGWTLASLAARGSRRSGSPLVEADAQNWRVNALISSAVLLAFLTIPLLRGTSYAHLVPYVDPALVLTVVLISLAVPVRMAWNALMELLNRAPDPAVLAEVDSIVRRVLEPLPAEELFVRVIQPGRTRFVSAHVVLPRSYEVESLELFDTLRERALRCLQEAHAATIVDLILSADRKWGAPLGKTGTRNSPGHTPEATT